MPLFKRCEGRPVWNGIDWDECFQQQVLNSSLPLALVLLSLFSLILHQLRRRRALAASAHHVATLDPGASSFSAALQAQSAHQQHGASRRSASSGFLGLPHRLLSAILPWNSSRIIRSNSISSVRSSTLPFGSSNRAAKLDKAAAASQAALEVFHTENAVILNEVHLTPPTVRDAHVLQRLRRLELLRRIIHVLGSVTLAALHAGDWATGWHSRSYQLHWAFLWFYLASLSAYSLATKLSFFSHKAALMSVYVVVTLFNLRTALLNRYAHPAIHTRGAVVLTIIQLVFGCIVLIPTLFFPMQIVLPRDLRAIYTTMSPETQHGVPGTAFPSPRLSGVDRLAPPKPATCDAAPGELIPAPEETASLLSRATFGYVTPAIVKHYRTQFTLAAVPDLPVADKAAAVVACFRAYTSARSDDSHAPSSNPPSSPKGLHTGLAPSTRPLWRRLFGHFKWFLALQFIWATLEAGLDLVPPFFLQKILAFIAARDERRRSGDMDGGEPIHLGVLYAFGMFVGQIFASISASRALFIGRRICIRLRAILITEIITKTLRRKDSGSTGDKDDAEQDVDEADDHDDSTAAAKKANAENRGKGAAPPKRATDGQVVNLISVDVFKVSEICAYLHFLAPRAPLVIGLCLVYLIVLLGWSAVIGFLVLLASLPIQTLVSRWFIKLQKRLLETTDKRLNLATEVLGCIKTVKFFAWERSFNTRMDEARQRELDVLRLRYLAWLCNTFTYMGTPMLVTCATFGAHTKIFHQPLTAEKAFTALALFNTLRNPLDALPDMIVQILNSLVSVRRIDTYLREEETQKYQQLLRNEESSDWGEIPTAALGREDSSPKARIGFEDASFTYIDDDSELDDDAFGLREINLNFPVGELSIVAGPVGSGKTTLLLSLLGETRQLSGRTFMPCPVARATAPVDPATGLSESVAYCSQSPWLLGTTLKENVLFGSPYDERRYRAVIKACALEPDLKILEYGDETEVGEKGTSLSGGQKARIALARALYSSAKHVLIDDALSAVDSHTAKHLYRHALRGALAKNRTIILVTHAISLCLPGAAFAVAMDNGSVVVAGTPDVVNATGVFSEEGEALQSSLKAGAATEHDEEMTIEELAAGGSDEAEREEMAKKLEKKAAHTNEETYSSGAVGTKNYGLYLGSVASKGRYAVLLWGSLLLFFFAVRSLDIGSGAWLMRWARSHDYHEDRASIRVLATTTSEGTSRFTYEKVQTFMNTPLIDSIWTNRPSLLGGLSFGSVLHRLPDPFSAASPAAALMHNFSDSTLTHRYSAADVFSGQHVLSLESLHAPSAATIRSSAFAQAQRGKSGDLDTYYLSIYLAISLSFMVMAVLRDGYEFFISLRASRRIYRRLTDAILNARPQFFDRTPVGRIMNRLSKDVETVDQEMAVCMLFLLECTLTATAILILICWATPIFLIVALIVICVYTVIGALYLVSSRDLKRIESVERSPIYTVVGEVLNGCVVIRAYGDAGRFTRHCLRLVDKANRAFFFLWCENRWLSVRVDIAGASVAFLSAVFLLLRTDIKASLAGFVLAYAITFVESVLWIVRMYTQTEINMNSVERISEYLDLEPEKQSGQEPPAYWPSSEGKIVIKNLAVRYTPEFPRVLDGIDLEFEPREKVGIVGRTGSGKSTLALCFFRFLEAEQGSIEIDGIDIGCIPIRTLRERLTVIPQDAQLFSGTVRSNLDPFSVYEDGELWTALERCRLASLTTAGASRAVSVAPSRAGSPMPAEGEMGAQSENGGGVIDAEMYGRTNIIASLDAPVEQGGRNFSAGQKQLLALARGLLKLRDSRILVLDESTANLDSASDAQIQKTIRQEMAPQATIITIAHRIKTIADYDKIVVLGKGKVVECGSPLRLMEDEQSVFHSMCEQSGEMGELLRIAKEADAQRRSNGLISSVK
ncbi:probable YBT1 - Vacuolar, ABC protein transporting bile acids [Melanopsichium pennsylvanicum]|uniref:Probable YBT1 - Vacuolar, ABC protein transporting bile acids n=2 Tax=Melanopsichium pennsylvanicum TaxID=63383 RepID=A0AAJ4XNK9_9BASI|nr:probable YBT1-Vacuolar, ABC protein transporting bile acids [Melanopsichium pennsylvanicum 4]SNX85131.1 probable YBT1 - Vacuolar, ABC protein transporting bile acids [Melanopsichium pennsylvanicum]